MIYFIQGKITKRIKIGFSKNPAQRIKQLQTPVAEDYEILLILPGEYKSESFFHKYFSEFRVKNEWFEPSSKLLEAIKEKQQFLEEKEKLRQGRENRIFLNQMIRYYAKNYGEQRKTNLSTVE
jgi:T5orf172 domain